MLFGKGLAEKLIEKLEEVSAKVGQLGMADNNLHSASQKQAWVTTSMTLGMLAQILREVVES